MATLCYITRARNPKKMPSAWTANGREKIGEWEHMQKQSSHRRRAQISGWQSEVAAPGDTGSAQSRFEQIHTNGSEGHDVVPAAE